MWPVQTLTLLLCLTDEEQLFAQSIPPAPQVQCIEATCPEPEVDQTTTLLIEIFS
ncbi:MAG: hypothetical protein IPP83_08045 [Flavobacteriales bacterium]|nr:hypothetical protein [Flavobacteriales bacterium]MBL0127403.1 hypothetical protein [Flavobacteriales bacterium]MCC6938531.1 hypothetical protein [Flavobacteriales bacterium]